MRGITVVGCGLDSGETLVAAAACAAVRASGEDPRLFVTAAIGPGAEAESVLVAAVSGQPFVSEHQFRTAASPVIAARHAGTELDPATLVAQARESEERLIVAAAPGGLMSPLTEHYSNRDFARELGLPLVIAARASGGGTGHGRPAGGGARAGRRPR